MKIKIVIKTLGIGLIAIILLAIVLKGVIARYFFDYEIEKIKSNHGLSVSAEKLEFTGIRTIGFYNLTLATLNSDTIAHFDTLETKLSIASFLWLKINPLEISVSNSILNIHNAISYNNWKCENEKPKPLKQFNEKNSSVRGISSMLRKVFGFSTAHFDIRNFTVRYTDSLYNESLRIPRLTYQGNEFLTEAYYADSNGYCKFNIAGFTSKKDNSLNITVSNDTGLTKIPFIEPLLNISAYFKTAAVAIQASEISSNKIQLKVKTKATKMRFIGARIAEAPVDVDSASFSSNIKIEPHSYCLDSSSVISFNKMKANLGVCYSTNPDTTIDIKFRTFESPWQELIESLPHGLFGNLSGIRVGGKFQYSLNVNVDLHNVDSLTIEPKLTSKGFCILSYGRTNLTAINDTFTHDVYVDGSFVKSIHLNRSNAAYTPLDNISPFIRWAVITSEDGSFYNHRGFDLDGIRYAMACNIREKRFARGGSTISQQLIKNLYLDRNKNITRKFEEFLLVWMIENLSIVSKDRMLEIYLNIIEWGPNIYGAKEACEYYFGKKPSEVSLREALFLAYIIPRPTKFKYLFEDESHLKPFMQNSFEFVSQKMLTRGYISEDDYSAIQTEAEFRLLGDAKYVLSTQTSAVDSVTTIEQEE
ncbi:MAG: transglycosylase domain-containing protein [Bacteroidales bacterium]